MRFFGFGADGFLRGFYSGDFLFDIEELDADLLDLLLGDGVGFGEGFGTGLGGGAFVF